LLHFAIFVFLHKLRSSTIKGHFCAILISNIIFEPLFLRNGYQHFFSFGLLPVSFSFFYDPCDHPLRKFPSLKIPGAWSGKRLFCSLFFCYVWLLSVYIIMHSATFCKTESRTKLSM
jgi:hypothetical protein